MEVSILGTFYLGHRSPVQCLQLSMKAIRPQLTRTSPPSHHTQISGSQHHCSWENPAILVVVKASLDIPLTKPRPNNRHLRNKLI